MIIHKPEIKEEGSEICVMAPIEFETPNTQLPDVLWYRFPKGYEDYITDRSDGFAASLLPLAMALGKNYTGSA